MKLKTKNNKENQWNEELKFWKYQQNQQAFKKTDEIKTKKSQIVTISQIK